MSHNSTLTNPGESNIPLDEKNAIKHVEEKEDLTDKLLSSNEELNDVVSNPEKAKAISTLKRDFKKIRYGLDAGYDEVPSMSKDVDYVKTGDELVWEVLCEEHTSEKILKLFHIALYKEVRNMGAGTPAKFMVEKYMYNHHKLNAREMIALLDESKNEHKEQDQPFVFPHLLDHLTDRNFTQEGIINAIAKIYLDDIEAIRKK